MRVYEATKAAVAPPFRLRWVSFWSFVTLSKRSESNIEEKMQVPRQGAASQPHDKELQFGAALAAEVDVRLLTQALTPLKLSADSRSVS